LAQPKKMLIDTAKQIAKVSAEFSKKAREISHQCPDKRMKHVSPCGIALLRWIYCWD